MKHVVIALLSVAVLAACGSGVPADAQPSVSLCGDTVSDAENRAALTYLDAVYQLPVASRGTDDGVPWCVFGSVVSPTQFWAAVYAGGRTPSWDLKGFPTVRLSYKGWVGFVTGEDGRPWTIKQASAAASTLAKTLANRDNTV